MGERAAEIVAAAGRRRTDRLQPRQIGLFRPPLGNLRSRGNAWWRTQSPANWSQRAHSLLTGKYTGNFFDFARTGGSERLLSSQESKTYRRIPYKKKQGIFAGVAGIFRREQRKLTRKAHADWAGPA
jgi:hypothetical protein